MDVTSVHHVALAVEDLDEAVRTYERLFGAEVERRSRIDDQGVEAVFLRIGGNRVELLAALEADSPVGRFLDKRGPGMHHLAFEVPDLAAAIVELEAAGIEVIDPAPRPGLGGHEVAFVHPDALHGVLVEVVSERG